MQNIFKIMLDTIQHNAIYNIPTTTLRGLTSSTYVNDKVSPDGDYNTVLTITSKRGRLIEDISRFEQEKEVLFASFSEFEVRDIEKIGDETHIILVEVGDDEK